jgi:hypothetical protein
MYTREQIIEEIKRIAEETGGPSLSQKDFEINSTIPVSTLRYYLGTWKQALKEAGLKPTSTAKKDRPTPKNNNELLLDLIRLGDEAGEVPTLALIESKGKFDAHHYTDRWRSISDAFQQARKKFPQKPPPTSKASDTNAQEEDILEEDEVLMEEKRHVPKSKPEPEPEPESEVSEEKSVDFDFSDLDDFQKPKKKIDFSEEETDEFGKIKFIPQTFKPKPPKKRAGKTGEPIRFRGLRSAPADKQGVIYLFGMIGRELGFKVQSFMTESPDAEGKRCVDQELNRWEEVSIQFEFKSSDFKAPDNEEEKCDIIVCWHHDWEECPCEVLELKPIVKKFQEG